MTLRHETQAMTWQANIWIWNFVKVPSSAVTGHVPSMMDGALIATWKKQTILVVIKSTVTALFVRCSYPGGQGSHLCSSFLLILNSKGQWAFMGGGWWGKLLFTFSHLLAWGFGLDLPKSNNSSACDWLSETLSEIRRRRVLHSFPHCMILKFFWFGELRRGSSCSGGWTL